MNVERLNHLSEAAWRELMLGVCGARRFGEHLFLLRPFRDEADLWRKCSAAWEHFTDADYREAFLAHPRIGERKAVGASSELSLAHSAEEQKSAERDREGTREALVLENEAYEKKFGHIFLIFASGKSSGEMLEALRGRILHTPEEEFGIACEEQRKITQHRLEKWLAKEHA